MMARRSVLRTASAMAVLGVMPGCSAEESPAKKVSSRSASGRSPSSVLTSSDSPANTTRVQTRLGSLTWVGHSNQPRTWREELVSAADAVEDRWAAVDSPVTITLCDDQTFAGLADGLDAGTAAVTTSSGIFLGAAFQHALTGQGRSVVLAHELTHARLGQYGDDRTQWWLKEGAAEWTAGALAPQLGAAVRWPNLRAAWESGSVSSGAPAARVTGSSLGYEWAHAYVSYLAAVCGADVVTALVRAHPADASARATGLCAGKGSFSMWLDRAFA